jgi:hypothetical protein
MEEYGTMATATFILGLCGSGKSCLARQMQTESGARLFDEDFIVTDQMQEDMMEELRNGRDCIVVEIWYGREHDRQEFVNRLRTRVPEAKIRWICFKNDPEKANVNVWRRPERDPARHVEINSRLAPRYTYPAGAEIIDVYEPRTE